MTQTKKDQIRALLKSIETGDPGPIAVVNEAKYIQHNPLAADGPEGLKSFLEFAKANLGSFKVEFKQVFADGDYVIVHVHATAGPEDRGSAVMDIFRLENGKVVEHWDVIQPIPETANNENTMF